MPKDCLVQIIIANDKNNSLLQSSSYMCLYDVVHCLFSLGLTIIIKYLLLTTQVLLCKLFHKL
jgi:hypothetical protein